MTYNDGGKQLDGVSSKITW